MPRGSEDEGPHGPNQQKLPQQQHHHQQQHLQAHSKQHQQHRPRRKSQNESANYSDVGGKLANRKARLSTSIGMNGEVHISMVINPTSRELHVSVEEVRGLPLHNNDEYPCNVRVCLLSDQSKSGKRRTKTVKKSSHAVFDEKLPALKIAREAVNDEMLKVQVFNDSASAMVGEVYIPLDKALRIYPDKLSGWFILQPGQKAKSSSIAKWSGKKGEPCDFNAALMSFLNDVINTIDPTSEEIEIFSFLKYKNKLWNDIVPEMSSSAHGKLVNALWELFSSEAAHLSVLSVLAFHFQRMLTLACNNKADARVRHVLNKVKVGRVFGNVNTLLEISLSFVKALERALVLAAEPLRKQFKFTDNTDTDISTALLNLSPIIEAFAIMQERLMEPEMKYRVNHEKARKYVKKLQSTDELFSVLVNWCEEDTRCDRHSLVDLLTQPLQRLTRYPLLLKAVDKSIPTSDVNKERFRELITELERAITWHDQHVRSRNNFSKLRKIQNTLVWPSAVDVCTNVFVSPVHTSFLNARNPIDLSSQWHQTEDLLGMSESRREYIHDSWLTTLSSTGKELTQLYLTLIGQLLIVAKSDPKVPRKSLSSSRQSKGNIYERDDMSDLSDDSDDEEYGLMVQDVVHLGSLVLLDVEDQTAVVKNCFTLVTLGGFGTPMRVMTLKADSSFDKSEWLRYLSHGIEVCGAAQLTAYKYHHPQSSEPQMAESRNSFENKAIFDSDVPRELQPSPSLHREVGSTRSFASTSSTRSSRRSNSTRIKSFRLMSDRAEGGVVVSNPTAFEESPVEMVGRKASSRRNRVAKMANKLSSAHIHDIDNDMSDSETDISPQNSLLQRGRKQMERSMTTDGMNNYVSKFSPIDGEDGFVSVSKPISRVFSDGRVPETIDFMNCSKSLPPSPFEERNSTMGSTHNSNSELNSAVTSATASTTAMHISNINSNGRSSATTSSIAIKTTTVATLTTTPPPSTSPKQISATESQSTSPTMNNGPVGTRVDRLLNKYRQRLSTVNDSSGEVLRTKRKLAKCNGTRRKSKSDDTLEAAMNAIIISGSTVFDGTTTINTGNEMSNTDRVSTANPINADDCERVDNTPRAQGSIDKHTFAKRPSIEAMKNRVTGAATTDDVAARRKSSVDPAMRPKRHSSAEALTVRERSYDNSMVTVTKEKGLSRNSLHSRSRSPSPKNPLRASGGRVRVRTRTLSIEAKKALSCKTGSNGNATNSHTINESEQVGDRGRNTEKRMVSTREDSGLRSLEDSRKTTASDDKVHRGNPKNYSNNSYKGSHVESFATAEDNVVSPASSTTSQLVTSTGNNGGFILALNGFPKSDGTLV
eukprot:m.104962 g.104962  ORF g.104962 m.104962 type:complete len:1330 (+) comp9121_c4_seq1:190-4179(+)